MMKRSLSVLVLLAALVVPAQAQVLRVGSISTAGADCSAATRCFDVDVRNLASVGIYLNVATSGTFVFEASADATSLTSGTWVAISDDAGGAANATADGLYFFTNPGYTRLRLRASAISGTASLTATRGTAALRSTATLSGGGDASLAEQQTQTAHLATIVTNTDATLSAAEFAAAFGTAGSADTQVMSVQGIASGTALPVTCGDCSGSGVSHIDDAAFTPATDDVVPIAGAFDDAAPDSVNEGDAGVVRMSGNRNLYTTIRDAAGNERGLNVDANGAIAAVVSASNLDIQSGGADVLSTTAHDAAFGTAGTADAQVRTVQGIASMTPLLVTAQAGDNDIGNVDLEIGGTAITAGAGAVGATTPRVTLASDDPVTVDIEEIRANSVLQTDDLDFIRSNLSLDNTHDNAIAATAPGLMLEAKDFDGSALPNVVSAEGDGVRAAGSLYGVGYSLSVNEDGSKALGKLEDDAHASADFAMPVLARQVTAAAASAGTTGDYATINTDALGLLWTRSLDPCSGVAKSYHIVNMSTATTVEIANAVANEFWYICSVNLVAAAAQTIAIGHDDTDGCGSITAGMHGGATAATGWSFAANGGIALGNGSSTVMKSATANHYLCVITGQSVQISGTISYVSAP